MHHRFQIIGGVDFRIPFTAGVEESLIDVALDRRASMDRAEGDPDSSGGEDFPAQSSLIYYLFRHLACVVSDRAERLGEFARKIIDYFIIDYAEYPRVEIP